MVQAPDRSPPPAARTLVATVLKADISGSTPLGERLDPEELRTVLGSYFAALAREIGRQQGSIDKYVGDAVIAVFGVPEPRADDARRAVMAAIGMQEAIARENEALEKRYGVRLACRIGVNTGEVAAGAVAGDVQAALTVIGETVTIAEKLEAAAALNTVLVSEATYAAARDAFRWEAMSPVTVKGRAAPVAAHRPIGVVHGAQAAANAPATAPGPPETSRSLQIEGAKEHVLAEERKIVTVLFADISSSEPLGAKLAPAELREVLGTYFGVLARAIGRFGGTIDKYVGDAVMAVFGAPISHEDDAARAIGAALAIHRAARALNDTLEQRHGVRLAIRIGINTGEVVAGLLPGEVRAYTVTGDAVNTAQRIESAAPPDAVLVSESTRALARKAFVFEAVPPLTLKGKAEPVPAYRVVGAEQRASAREGPTIVGRERELATLFAHYRNAAAGRGQVVHVQGEAGIGKTRLVAEVLAGISRQAGRVRARATSYEQATPYAVVADVVRRLFAVPADEDEPTARAALLAGLDAIEAASRDAVVTVLLEILGYDVRSPLDPQGKRRLIVSLLRGTLERRSAVAPLVVLLEDLHWSDATSAEVLREVTAIVPSLRCLFISTAREATEVPWPAERIALDALAPEAAVQMIDRLAAVPIDDATRTVILERTAGNPFFIEEVVRSLKDGKAGAVPATVQELLEARLDALEASPRQVAQRAAVIGRVFARGIIERVAPGPDLDGALVTLERERMVDQVASAPEPVYSFPHALVQEVVYRTQLISQRRRTHVAVGDAYGDLFKERLDDYVDTLAFHYRRGDDDPKARTWLLRAGHRAQRLYANAEALDYFRGALERSGDDPDARGIAHEGIGDVLRIVAAYRDALAAYGEAIALRAAAESGPVHARLLRKTGVIHTLTGASARAVEVLETALAELARDEHAERSRILLQFAEIRWRAARYDDAIALLRESISNAKAAGDDVARAEALKQLGTVHVFKGDKREGLRFYGESLALYDRADDPIAKAHVLNNIGATHDRLGSFEEARQAHEAAATIRERFGDLFGIAQSRNNLGEVYRARGDLTRAEQNFQAALEAWQSIGHASVGLARTGIGITAIERGDAATARRELTIALRELEGAGNRTYQLDTQRSLARAYLPDDPETALRLAQSALAATQELGTADREGLAWQVLGLVQEARGEQAEAIAALERARRMLAETGDRHELARTLVALARIYRGLPDGDPRRAEVAALVDEARATFAAIGAALDLRRLGTDGEPV